MNGQSSAWAPGTPRRRAWLAAVRSLAWSAGPRPQPTRRDIAVDVALAVIAALASWISLRAAIPASAHPYAVAHSHGVVLPIPARLAPGISLTGLLTIPATTLPLAVRRLRPLAAFCIIVSCTILGHRYINGVTFLSVLFSGYSAVVHSRYRGLALLSVPAAGVVAAAAFPNTTPPLPGRYSALLFLVLVAIAGNATRVWLRQAGDSEARLVSMQAEHEAATRRAIETERARVASELHDVVTHNVSVMVVQAGAARKVLSASPGEATTALLAVEASGRAALTELRHLLGLLAPAGGPEACAAAGDGAASLRPQPGLGQLPALIDRVATAGLPVELDIGGSPGALPPGLDLAAYRVVQEALTNVMNHAGHARTTVRLDYRPDELVIEVTDDGPAAGTATAGTATAGTATAGTATAGTANAGPVPGPAPMPSSGRGLIGLRERVELYGGSLDAGRRPGGGWRTVAHLPLEITVPSPAP